MEGGAKTGYEAKKSTNRGPQVFGFDQKNTKEQIKRVIFGIISNLVVFQS